MAAVDAALAERITGWGAWSAKKTQAEIDAWVDAHDPGALRRCRESASHQSVQFGSPADVAATTTIYARLTSADAALIEQSVDQSARSVCDGDPRTMDQRRVDAFTAAFTPTVMACGCGQPDCPGASADKPAKNAMVYVIVDEKSVDATESVETEQAPTPLLGAILDCAKIREVRHPGPETAPEPRYTPASKTAEFVRCRDVTCRFPGCDQPAPVCDIDHTAPYPVGPTHPSNLKCLCRFHHLLKTFWQGLGSWLDRQLPDGTIIWTSPTSEA